MTDQPYTDPDDTEELRRLLDAGLLPKYPPGSVIARRHAAIRAKDNR